MQAPISVNQLVKDYGDVKAVKGIDFQVERGEVFGLLGPNGAGKTTTVEILEGLRNRTSGSVSVLGLDPETQSNALKDRIGVALQATNLPEKIKVLEAVELFASFYSHAADPGELLRQLELEEKAGAYYSQLSGGQKQRLALALALINNPQIVFLDEPTAGLDPQARQRIHELIQQLKRQDRTVLLTTHYIEEAEKLCDRVAIIDNGTIIADGTPEEIRSRTIGASLIEISCAQALPEGGIPDWNGAEAVQLSRDRKSLSLSSARPAQTLVELVKWIDERGMELTDVHLKRPSLEDVFIELTGRSLRE